MGGITHIASPGEVAIRALEAGVDILLMPPDPVSVITAIAKAVESGRLTEARIEESLQRILKAKEKLVQAPAIGDLTVNLQPLSARKLVNKILTTALKTGGGLPIPPLDNHHGKNLIVVDDLLNADFLDRACPALSLPKQEGYETHILTPELLNHYPLGKEPFLLQIFLRGNPFRGTAGLTPQAQALYYQCLANKSLQGLIIYGSPYVLDWFQTQIAEICPELPWVFSHGQMPQAQAIAINAIFGGERFLEQSLKDRVFT